MAVFILFKNMDTRIKHLSAFSGFIMQRFIRRLLFTRWHRGFK
jgi:hypothetical protein